MRTPIDLRDAPVIDDHSHAFSLADCLAAPPQELECRLTFMGMAYRAAESFLRPTAAEWERIGALTGSSVFALAARRHLARLLGCDETAEAVASARRAALAADARAYLRRLWADQSLRALIVDEGYPDDPPVPRAAFAAEAGLPVYRAWRLETYVLETAAAHDPAAMPPFADFVDGFLAALETAAADPATVAVKSVIAYVGGLQVRGARRSDAADAYSRWTAAGMPLEGEDVATVVGHLVHLTLQWTARSQMPVHLHCGAGDPGMTDMQAARPAALYPLLARHREQPIVLVHAGHPWLGEAAAMAAVLPNVYLDLSAWQPWATSGSDSGLARLIGSVPTEKLLYGTDNVLEPEVLWLGALLMKRSLERVLGDAVDHDLVSPSQAEKIGRGILAGNTVKLHGLDPELCSADGSGPGGIDQPQPDTAGPALPTNAESGRTTADAPQDVTDAATGRSR